MTLTLIGCALVIYLVGALCAACAGKRAPLASFFGGSAALGGGLFGLAGTVLSFVNIGPAQWHGAWSVPLGALSVKLDALGAFFLAPLFVLTTLAAFYGMEYLRPYGKTKNLGLHWCFYNLLSAAMVVVVIASDSVLFLISWEVMSLASFFLVIFDHEHAAVRNAGWIYLVATHIGMLFLLVFFLTAGFCAGSTDMQTWVGFKFSKSAAAILFCTALVGFGSKAGFFPFHVWLPEAHPAAPSHVSAVMSGIMIKMGIYGIMRAISILPFPPAWWGALLVVLGGVSGVLGVLLALGQHDLKRLLAYHSVENIGIITLGLGCGLLGVHYRIPALAALGFAGALLHVVNHALFKGLLFLSAGCVLNKTGTLALDRLGGLLKRMPVTALCFLIGAVAICGLPPLNGFISEFLIYNAAFAGLTAGGKPLLLAAVAVVFGLALIGGLALACFTKAFGIVFLGQARVKLDKEVSEPGRLMLMPMVILSLLCVGIGLGFGFVINLAEAPIGLLAGGTAAGIAPVLDNMRTTLIAVAVVFVVAALLIAIITAVRRRLLSRRNVRSSETWGCGYGNPKPSMQYTASSFADPLVSFFALALRPHKRAHFAQGLFPMQAEFTTHVPDLALERVYTPLFRQVEKALKRLRWLQGGKVNYYVLYIAATLLLTLMGVFLWPR
ncbi:MAG: proton-conducting transporter membrane subunit [Chitinivibrionales bacterium]|nr:proton-conducting transporter membrane subunit [Chitinivibrionales bacterium]